MNAEVEGVDRPRVFHILAIVVEETCVSSTLTSLNSPVFYVPFPCYYNFFKRVRRGPANHIRGRSFAHFLGFMNIECVVEGIDGNPICGFLLLFCLLCFVQSQDNLIKKLKKDINNKNIGKYLMNNHILFVNIYF